MNAPEPEVVRDGKHEHPIYPRRLVFTLNMAVFLFESGAFWLYLDGVMRLESLVGLHYLVCILVMIWFVWCVRRGFAITFPAFTFMFILCLGPLGALTTAYAVAFIYLRRRTSSIDDWYAMLYPEEKKDEPQKLYDDLTRMERRVEEAGESDDVTPLMDVITHGGYEMKQAAIVLMSKKFIPAFTPVLRKALNDSNSAIRVLAATAMSRIEGGYVEKAIQCEQDLNADASAENLLKMADHYDDHAWSGILEQNQQEGHQHKALEYYRQYLELVPNDLKVVVKVGRLMVKMGRAKKAALWMKSYEEKGCHDANFLLWYLEALYAQGLYSYVRRLVMEYGDALLMKTDFPPTVAEAAAAWGLNIPRKGRREEAARVW